MNWFDIHDPNDKLLDELATKYGFHPLHVEDCRHPGQSSKIEVQGDYLFVVLKPVDLINDCEIKATDLDLFLGPDYLVVVREGTCPAVEQMMSRLNKGSEEFSPGQFFYRIFDGVVDLYHPSADKLSEYIDKLEEQALSAPQSSTVEDLFALRRALIELRRVLANTRDVLGHILRSEYPQLSKDLQPFFRDIYDHVARNLDNIEIQRDLVTGATELYLSSVANQTNQVMKVLTVFGTVATPAIVITGIYGMNVKNLPFAESPHSWGIVMTIIGFVSGLMLLVFRKLRWL